MNWRVKGVAQKVLSAVPGGVRVNDWLQRTVGDLRDFEANVGSKVNADWVVLVGHMIELGIKPQGLRYLEIGTGWFPALPVCYSLAGADSCATFDLVDHLNGRLTFRMLDALQTHLPAIATASLTPLQQVQNSYAQLKQAKTLAELLERARIEYHAPADATASGLPDESVDVVFSNSVLEHVPRETILRLMQESARVLRRGGLSIHSANCGDHYAYFDKNITAINYLTYSERDWRLWNNELQYQNRLRPQDFLGLAEQAGLEIALKKHKPRADLLDALPKLQIAPEFQHYPPEQLCCTSIDFVARKP
jgi:SAM-dependent methyltransferase